MEQLETSAGEEKRRATEPSLRRNYLSFIENAAQMLGGMAPAGTMGVILPLLILRGRNSTWLIFLVTLLAFSLVLVCINRFSELSASSGALSSFAEAGLGRRAGLVTGWIYIGAMGFSAAGTAPSCAYYADLVLTQLTGEHGGMLRWLLLTVGAVALAWAIAYRDIKLSTEVTLAIELSTVALLLLIVFLALRRSNAWVDPSQFHLVGTKLTGVQFGLVFGFMTLAGFESVTTLGDEAQQPTRTIPRAIKTFLLPVGFLYLIVIYSLVAISRKEGLPLDRLAAPFDVLAHRMGRGELGMLSSVGIALSYFACTLAALNASARILYSLAGKGMFARRFGEAHPVNATPHRAIALLAAIGMAIPSALLLRGIDLWDCVNLVTQLAAFGFIGSYFMVCLAMPFYLRKQKALRNVDAGAAGAALMILGIVLALSIFPVPPAPWRYQPYIFLGSMIIGISASAYFWRKNKAQHGSALRTELADGQAPSP